MPESSMLVYIFGEVALLLLAVCVFLLVHTRKRQQRTRQLEEKIVELRDTCNTTRKEAKDALKELAEYKNIAPKDYLDFLEDEIGATRVHHSSLKPDRDIVLDISADAPMERQAASLRHAFLLAEKESALAAAGSDADWDTLQAKFQQIIEFYEQPNDGASEAEGGEDETVAASAELDEGLQEQIEQYKARISNLERFKHLFFNMESKWEKAKKEAEEYHQQLLAKGQELGGGEDFESVLNNYANVYGDINGLMDEGGSYGDNSGGAKTVVMEVNRTTVNTGPRVIANQEEMMRLRNMAIDQHKIIESLKHKLMGAASEEQQEEIVQELSTQLQQQEQFIKEAETCTQLLEEELTRTITENESLRNEMQDGGANAESEADAEQLQGLLQDMTEQSKEMLATIAALEDENRKLQQMVADGTAGAETSESPSETGASGGGDEVLKEKLDSVQQELLNLQTQHIELEERYLELKMQNI